MKTKIRKSRPGGTILLPGTLVSIVSFRQVGHGVGQTVDPHFDPHEKVQIRNKKHPKSDDFRCFLELLGGFEPPTSSLPKTICTKICFKTIKNNNKKAYRPTPMRCHPHAPQGMTATAIRRDCGGAGLTSDPALLRITSRTSAPPVAGHHALMHPATRLE